MISARRWICSLYLLGGSGALLVSATVDAAKAPSGPIELAPLSEWKLIASNNSCKLSRLFGQGENQTLLEVDQFGINDAYRVTFAGNALTRFLDGVVRFQFGPNEAVQRINGYTTQIENDVFAIVSKSGVRVEPVPENRGWKDDQFPIQFVSAERKAAVTFIRIESGKARPLVLSTGPMDKPFASLQQCADDMVKGWGVDVGTHKSLKRAAYPKANPGSWVNFGSYPPKLQRKNQSTVVEFRLDVDEAGAAIGCQLLASDNLDEFGDAVCASLMNRAKFNPAIAEDGQPVRSYWINSVTFMPADQ
jgi:Gram-negative bacterial TonB protein C-terminal